LAAAGTQLACDFPYRRDRVFQRSMNSSERERRSTTCSRQCKAR
jgi:hypothetical protein